MSDAKTDAYRLASADAVLQVLQTSRGAEYAVSAPNICEALRWAPGREREVRQIIEENANSKWEGTLCAIPGRGYFFAKTIEEIAAYRKYLLSLRDASKIKLERFDAAAEREGFSLKGVR